MNIGSPSEVGVMTIKFPDLQVLVTRVEQIPKITREGDPSMTGKVAPQVATEHLQRPSKVNDASTHTRITKDKEHEREHHKNKGQNKHKQSGNKQNESKDGKGDNLDIRV